MLMSAMMTANMSVYFFVLIEIRKALGYDFVCCLAKNSKNLGIPRNITTSEFLVKKTNN